LLVCGQRALPARGEPEHGAVAIHRRISYAEGAPRARQPFARARSSVEVPALDLHEGPRERRRPYALGDEVNEPLLHLQLAGDAEQRGRADDRPELLEHALPHDDVDEPGLVLERHEHDARGGARLLPADHQADVLDALAIAAAPDR